MSYYNELKTLNYNATLAKYNQLETMQEDFRLTRKSFNIALVDYIQNEFSANIQLLESLDNSYFNIRVTNSYWSVYRQDKLDNLEETLKGLVKTLEIMPVFVPEYTSEDGTTITETRNIFEVMVSHR